MNTIVLFSFEKITQNHIYFLKCNCDLQTKLPSFVLLSLHHKYDKLTKKKTAFEYRPTARRTQTPKDHLHNMVGLFFNFTFALLFYFTIVGQTLITIQEKSWFSKWHKVHLKMCPHAQTNKNTAATTTTKSFHRRKREEERKWSCGGGSKHFERYFWKSQKVVSKEGTF